MPRGRKREPLITRLERHRDIAETGCWLWTGRISTNGYGQVQIDRQPRNVHRVAYELLVGPIKDGLVIDHLCRVRHCFNPEHLEAVTQKTNINRGNTGMHELLKTHCPFGHPYVGENLFFGPNGSRRCRECSRINQRRYRANRDRGLGAIN